MSGLGIGWRLAQAGLAVEIYERARAGAGASDAAAGMLAACVECEPGEQGLLALTRLSQTLWPDFRDELEEASGERIGYRGEGTLVAALTRDDAERLRFSFDYQRGLGLPLEWLSAAEARRLEPQLKPGLSAAIFSPEDHQVDNRLLVRALKAAFAQAGGSLHEGRGVKAVTISGERVAGIELEDGGKVEADLVVLCQGPWAREMAGLPPALLPPVRPVKGQMLALAMDARFPLIEHVLWAPGIYLVPRGDGRLIVGATVEEKGFDGAMTAGGLYALLEAAWRVLPGIEELPLQETWVGHRPTSRDDAPILGPTAVEGLHLATGHHRNGILLAPITADAVAEAILTGRVPEAIAAFGLERFAGPSLPLRAGAGA